MTALNLVQASELLLNIAHTTWPRILLVETPAGRVVIGGDAGNDLPLPPRLHLHPNRWNDSQKERTSSCIRQFIPFRGPTKAAASTRMPSFVRAASSISA